MVGLADSWWFTIRNSNIVSIKFNSNDNVDLEIGKMSYKNINELIIPFNEM